MTDGGLRENWKGPKPTKEEIDQERRELEEAGWEYVMDAVGKHFWRKPDSGRLYPQDAAVSVVRGENVADDGGEESVSPTNVLTLMLSYWRWQLSATELWLAWWRTSSYELWRAGSTGKRDSSGPSLVTMYRETMQDTFESDRERTTT